MKKNDNELIPVERRKKVITVDNGRRRRRRRRKGIGIETVGYVFEVLAILIVVSIGAGFFLVNSHLSKIRDTADKAVVEVLESQDGTCVLSWSAVGEADIYYVEVSTNATLGGRGGEEMLFHGYIDATSCRLPNLPKNETVTIRIDLIKKYTLFGEEKAWKQASAERVFYPGDPVVKELNWDVDPDTGIASINYVLQEGNGCSIYVTGQDGGKKLLKNVEGEKNSVELDFNGEEGLWMPEPGTPCTLTIVPGKLMGGSMPIAYYGGEAKNMVVTWEDFAARDIALSLNLVEDCICRLEWGEADVDFYEVQMREGDKAEWNTVKTTPQNGERTYTSVRLKPGVKYSFRVKAVIGDYEAVAFSDVQECEAEVVTKYCTIWPVKNLDVYSSPDKSEKIGQIGTLDAYSIVDEQDGMFGINLDGVTGYIDSNYCMINLTEYLGDLCSYNITNSYNSIFMAHGFEIPGLTGWVINGFEHVRLADGSFLVPLLYPTAAKLQAAMETAKNEGYRLKIYESFRPHKASVYMYNTAMESQNEPLPLYGASGEEIYEPGLVFYKKEINEYGELVERRITYWELMNNDDKRSYRMTDFVSAGISRHNLGVALDLTLEDIDTRVEMIMQSDMHDLSWYSERDRNEENGARILNKLMKSAGFNDLYSEWWHFQDDESRIAFNLPYVEEGVTPECWMENGFGRRYRDINGNYVISKTINIGGREYTFDADGYVQD